MSPETMSEPSVEKETNPEPAPFDRLVEICRDSRIPLSVEQLAWLVPNIEVRDLKEHHVGKQYGVEPLAIASHEGISLDLRYNNLPLEQQKYVLGHELGHFLSSYLRSTDNELWSRLNSVAKSLPSGEISSYISFLDESLKDDQSAEKITEERLAELITQYINGGGTFAGMMSSKLVHLPNFEQTPEDYNRLEQEAVELEGLLEAAENEEAASELVKRYPKLQPHLAVWQMIRGTFGNSETFQPLENALSGDEQWNGYIDDDWIDYPELGEQIEPIFSPKPVPPTESSEQPEAEKLPFDFLKFWKIFD